MNDPLTDPFLAMEAMRPKPRRRPCPDCSHDISAHVRKSKSTYGICTNCDCKGTTRTVSSAEMKRRKTRGAAGEREVVRWLRVHGWSEAFRTPGSGAWRPYGAADVSPFPVDVATGWPPDWPEDRRQPLNGPWMFEVKFNESLDTYGRGWPGEAFVRKTLRTLQQQAAAYNRGTTGREIHAALWGRTAGTTWRVWVPAGLYLQGSIRTDPADWVEVTPEAWNDLAHELMEVSR